MGPIEHIRKNVFDLSQTAFAEIAGTTQASVSRWENGEQAPDQIEMSLIRAAALKRGIAWEDSWFFEVPRTLKKVSPPTREQDPQTLHAGAKS